MFQFLHHTGARFGEYEAAATDAGALVHSTHAEQQNHFQWDLQSALQGIRRSRPAVTFLCTPNNLTGVILILEEVCSVAQAAVLGLLVVDEAMPHRWPTDPGLQCRRSPKITWSCCDR